MKPLFLGTLMASLLELPAAVNAQHEPHAVAQELSGWYIGAKTGISRTSLDDADSNEAWTVGADVGHNLALRHGWMVGANLFYDYNASADHTPDFIEDALDGDDLRVGTHAYGISGKRGDVAGPAMDYGKVGAGRLEGVSDVDDDGGGIHGGVRAG